MVDNVNSNASGKEVQQNLYNGKKLAVGDGKSFALSIFGKGFVINSGFEELFSDYDRDCSGDLDAEEAKAFVRDLVAGAGDDDILDDSEIAQLFAKTQDRTEVSEKRTALFKAFVAMTLNGAQKLKVEHYVPDEETTYSSMNKDGSGVKVSFIGRFNGYSVETYGKGNVLKERVINTNCDMRADSETMTYWEPNATTHIVYNSKGKPVEQFFIAPQLRLQEPFTEHTFFEYDKEGNLLRKNSRQKNMNTGALTTTRTDFYASGKNKETLTTFEYNGRKNSELLYFAEDGETVTGAKISKEKDGLVTVEEYEGANMANRLRRVPSRVTVYDKATKAVKSVTTNEFSEDGILIGKVVEDKVKNLKMSYDYRAPNGEVEDSEQGEVGNCFYLETINSLNTNTNGKKILAGTFGKEVRKDENGDEKTVFKVAFGGAPQIIEDLTNGIRNFPRENVFIQPEYEISEEELKDACLKAGKDYSTGDKDVLLLELAFAKYRKDVVKTVEANEEATGLFSDNDLIAGLDFARGWGEDMESANGGVLGLTMYLFTGKKSDVYMTKSETVPVCQVDADGNLSVVEGSSTEVNTRLAAQKSNVFDKRYDNIDEVLAILSADTDEEGKFKTYCAELGVNITSQVVDGKVLRNGGHAFTIKGIRADKAVLVNPWDSKKDAYMSVEDLKRAARMLNFVQPPERN